MGKKLTSKIDKTNMGILSLVKKGLLTEKEASARFVVKHRSEKAQKQYLNKLLSQLDEWDVPNENPRVSIRVTAVQEDAPLANQTGAVRIECPVIESDIEQMTLPTLEPSYSEVDDGGIDGEEESNQE